VPVCGLLGDAVAAFPGGLVGGGRSYVHPGVVLFCAGFAHHVSSPESRSAQKGIVTAAGHRRGGKPTVLVLWVVPKLHN
jgi:hypothetical protein